MEDGNYVNHNATDITQAGSRNLKYNKRKQGSKYEKYAAEYLKENGVKILEMNFSSKAGEVDIIGLDKTTYIFVEVKYRKNDCYGTPAEAVTYTKQQRICRVAGFYKIFKKLPDDADIRFDVISILDKKITWHKNAFLYHV